MRIAQLTNEYPPHVYGGAGVHIEYLAREHAVQVLAFGSQALPDGNPRVRGVAPSCTLEVQDPRHARLLDALLRDLAMVGLVDAPDVVHCHTWYTHMAGCFAKQTAGAKL